MGLLTALIFAKQISSIKADLLIAKKSELPEKQIIEVTQLVLENEAVILTLIVVILILLIILCIWYILKIMLKYRRYTTGIYVKLSQGINVMFIKLSNENICSHSMVVAGDLKSIRITITHGIVINMVNICLNKAKILTFENSEGYKMVDTKTTVEIAPFKTGTLSNILSSPYNIQFGVISQGVFQIVNPAFVPPNLYPDLNNTNPDRPAGIQISPVNVRLVDGKFISEVCE